MALVIRTIAEARELAHSIADELGLSYDLNCLTPEKCLAESREENLARVIARVAKNRRGAGKRALIAKVGYAKACQITGSTLQR